MTRLLLLLLITGCASTSDGLTIQIAVPPNTPDSVYAAGNFNDWNPADPAFRLHRVDEETFARSFDAIPRGEIAFKLTLGRWSRVEVEGDASESPNRSFVYRGGRQTYASSVVAWRSGDTPRSSTASENVSVLDSAMQMPQLRRSRRVQIYLPRDYADSDQRYPVLYVHDGQNVFDETTTAFGTEWGIDETLDWRHARGRTGAIVVAIDHGGDLRLDEYGPFVNAQYGGGEGPAYVAFLAETLKPLIDARFRTLPDPAHTGILGSSMGGLISLYTGLTRPDVFGRVGVFSPSLWFAEEQMLVLAREADVGASRFYFVSALPEGPSVAAAQTRMVELLIGQRFGAEVESVLRSEGSHTEAFWAGEFGEAFEWLFPTR